MSKTRNAAFTLVEVLIVVVIMAVLAATIIPQFSDSTKDAKVSSANFNLHTLRSQIQLYKSQHDGKVPTSALAELVGKTDSKGTIDASGDYGPYVSEIPSNPFTDANSVTAITNSPAQAADVTGTGGWLYNATTGEIFIDHADYFTE
jgi:general secretion pathway protein G